MSQNKEAAAFLSRIAKLPKGPVSLDAALQPSIDDEAELRKLFATDKTNTRLKDIHVGLLDVFAAPSTIKTTRARVVQDEADLTAKHVMALPDKRRRKEGVPAMVEDIDSFKKNWSVFTEGSLSQLLDWNNVVAAGGSVLACLEPLPKAATVSKRAMRKHYHDKTFPSSDVDLFLWGMNAEQAERKINQIYEAVRDSVPWDVTCVRTKHTVSIHSQYPYRCVQIVLRLYKSPAEILAGFDVDAPCCAYDGTRVWANPRAIVAIMRQANTVDMTRRSPSYEVRLAKYASRGFEVYIPALKREDVDPTIYERSINRIQGLARLLVLEKLARPEVRQQYLAQRSALRGRPTDGLNNFHNSRRGRTYKGDLKAETAFSGLEMNDYDVVSLHIPYGPGWDARRIEKLIFKTDLGMNSPFNPKNKGRKLHRHPAFFGTMEQCLDDCCGDCIEPANEEEFKLQDEEDKVYIRGHVEFIADDPGRQTLSGSFNPIDEGEWSEMAYIQATAKFFNAIAAGDAVTVRQMLAEGEDVNLRDYVGRTSLHVAIMSNNVDVATILIDAGARMTARLVGGRSSLHLAAQMGQVTVVKKMLERSAFNEEKAKEEKAKTEAEAMAAESDSDRPSSEDDWSSEDDDGDDDMGTTKRTAGGKPAKAEDKQTDAEALEDSEDEPDILSITETDWDFAFTPLDFAIMAGSLDVVDFLLAAGADPKLPTRAKQGQPLHPLTVTMFTPDEDRAAKIAERLLAAGAISSVANENLVTIFHRVVCSEKTKIVSALLRHDPNASTVVDFPAWVQYGLVYPVVSAILRGDYATLAVLLAHGAQLVITAESVSIAEHKRTSRMYLPPATHYAGRVHMPLEVAIVHCDDVVKLLTALGAEVNMPIKSSVNMQGTLTTLLQWTTKAITALDTKLGVWKEQVEELPVQQPTEASWRRYRAYLASALPARGSRSKSEADGKKLNANKDYLIQVEAILREHGAQEYASFPSGTLPPGLLPGGTFQRNLIGRAQMATPTPFGQPAMAHMPIALPLQSPAIMQAQIQQQAILQTAGLLQQQVEQSAVRPGGGPFGANVMPLSLYGSQVSGYLRHTRHSTIPIPIHLKSQYDDLYEACWSGDNARIEELCLPKHVSTLNPPIQISVESAPLPGPFRIWSGYTPLTVALHRKHWATARLVLAIAAAQYKPEEEKSTFNANAFIRDDSDSGSDSMDDDEDEDEDDGETEQQEINFTDIAARPSTVESEVPAGKMLEQSTAAWFDSQGKPQNGTPLLRAIKQDDFEAFVNIIDLYPAIGLSIWPGATLSHLIQEDRPEMLDEFLRRTGAGISITVEVDEAGNTPAQKGVPKAEQRVYRGLNVGGKKMQQLPEPQGRRKIDIPNRYILLREAIHVGASKIVGYLAGPRPLAAFQHYAASHSDDRALYIRQIEDFESVLPKQLGWEINERNESPLTSAILYGQFDLLKKLFEYQPNMMTTAMNLRVQFVGFNAFLTAAFSASSPEIIDFLLEKGCDPSERDARGWNVYHLVAVSPNPKRRLFLDHLLKTLPKEMTREMMSQQSREALNTPLMLAVKRGSTASVRSMLEFGIDRSVFLLKDVSGSNVLHVAVQQASTDIASMLCVHGPEELLHGENGVGQTPLDIASQKDLTERTRTGQGPWVRKPNDLQSTVGEHTGFQETPFELEKQKVQIPKLRATLDTLLADGRLERGTSLATELLAFADSMEAKLAEAIAAKKEADDAAGEDIDPLMPTGSVTRTADVIREAVALKAGRRQLVHILDVQQSVKRNLEHLPPIPGHSRYQGQTTFLQGILSEADPDAQKDLLSKMNSIFHHATRLFTGTIVYAHQTQVDVFGADKL
ncbi:ankyrin [Artomyces pyxidatus]|uniref:Ankyrin n=1 Tax=Artomyces pyxidatus TaxID=48021 RepID=A0ACB8ST35_9AGAM|nr:ankyrin [Artomyces pyxidatus]